MVLTMDEKDKLHYIKKWETGDLLTVSRSGGAIYTKQVPALSEEQWASFKGYFEWVPESSKLLYLGQWATRTSDAGKRDTPYYVKCLWNGKIYWVETTRLRLLPQGRKTVQK